MLTLLLMDLEESLQQLKQFSFAVHTLSDVEWRDFSSVWQRAEAQRKTILTSKGETERTLYFITAGVQRAYYLTNDIKRQPSYLRILFLFQEWLILF